MISAARVRGVGDGCLVGGSRECLLGSVQ